MRTRMRPPDTEQMDDDLACALDEHLEQDERESDQRVSLEQLLREGRAKLSKLHEIEAGRILPTRQTRD